MRTFFLYFIGFILLFSQTLFGKTVYFLPIDGLDIQLFFDPYLYRDEVAKPFCQLREELEKKGYKIRFTSDAANLEDFECLISFNALNPTLLRNLKSYPSEKCLLCVFEPPVFDSFIYTDRVSESFGKILVMFDDMVDNQKYFKLYYPQPRTKMIEEKVDFDQKKFSVMINSNKGSGHPYALYNERIKVIDFYEILGTEELDLFGYGWNGYKCFKGQAGKKWDVLKNYKFSFCYENMKNQNGYVSEKIFDCFVAGCVPIYFGASNITEYVPKECFIDRRDFSSDEELYLFLKNMDREIYESYQNAIKAYFDSPQVQLFSINNFIKIITENLSL